MIVGLFRRSAKGFGFVRPHRHGPRRPTRSTSRPRPRRDASSGDEVAVKITKRPTARRDERRRAGRPGPGAGLGRSSSGTYFEAGDAGFVKIDGTTFHDPIYVGDPGAKGAKPGDKVALEIVRYPTPYREGEGVITEILGQRGQPGVDTLTRHPRLQHPRYLRRRTSSTRPASRPSCSTRPRSATRLDLRELLTVTIDPATARDFDDAISLSRDERGYWSLGVHIADVSHFVRAGSALDRAARHRGTSVYLPDRVIPMLPGDPLEQPGEPPGRPHAVHRQRAPGVQPRGHPDRRSGSPGRRSGSTIGSPTSRRFAVMKQPAQRPCRRRARGRRDAGRRCSSWR